MASFQLPNPLFGTKDECRPDERIGMDSAA
jgi:hypothetical protein